MSKIKTKRVQRHSPAYMIGIWIASLVSLGLLYLSGVALLSDFGSFRSCNANSSGLSIQNCGKHSLDIGDLIIIGLFILCAALVVSLFTAAWRATRGVTRE